MNELMDHVGGWFTALVSAGLMAGTMAMIYVGKVSPEVGFGFIAASLIPLALGHAANKQHKKQMAQAKKLSDDSNHINVEVGLGVVKKVNENHEEIKSEIAKVSKKGK
jgi:hypothetical protein